jgi:hypothetical protein
MGGIHSYRSRGYPHIAPLGPPDSKRRPAGQGLQARRRERPLSSSPADRLEALATEIPVSGQGEADLVRELPTTGLAKARKARDAARKPLAEGQDQSAERKAERSRRIEESERTFSALAKDLLAKQERDGRAKSTLRKNEWVLDRGGRRTRENAGRRDQRAHGAEGPADGRSSRHLRDRAAAQGDDWRAHALRGFDRLGRLRSDAYSSRHARSPPAEASRGGDGPEGLRRIAARDRRLFPPAFNADRAPALGAALSEPGRIALRQMA